MCYKSDRPKEFRKRDCYENDEKSVLKATAKGSLHYGDKSNTLPKMDYTWSAKKDHHLYLLKSSIKTFFWYFPNIFPKNFNIFISLKAFWTAATDVTYMSIIVINHNEISHTTSISPNIRTGAEIRFISLRKYGLIIHKHNQKLISKLENQKSKAVFLERRRFLRKPP